MMAPLLKKCATTTGQLESQLQRRERTAAFVCTVDPPWEEINIYWFHSFQGIFGSFFSHYLWLHTCILYRLVTKELRDKIEVLRNHIKFTTLELGWSTRNIVKIYQNWSSYKQENWNLHCKECWNIVEGETLVDCLNEKRRKMYMV